MSDRGVQVRREEAKEADAPKENIFLFVPNLIGMSLIKRHDTQKM